MVHVDPCEPGTEHTTPLFCVGGKCLTVRRVRKLARDIFKAAGQKGRTEAHAFRIGGATDLTDEGASQALLQAKGRWPSDIGRIYARMTRRAQLAASRAMQRSRNGGRDMEELFPGFTRRPPASRVAREPQGTPSIRGALGWVVGALGEHRVVLRRGDTPGVLGLSAPNAPTTYTITSDLIHGIPPSGVW